MCGINGWIAPAALGSAAEPPREQIAAMNRALAHRGPDGEGEYLEAGLALGHRRLSIIDLSDAGHQPMFNEDESLVLVFNGEIYNYLELIPTLEALGHVFRSRCDSEVILHAYEEWGTDCVQRFVGMWAFAIWDRRRRRLFLSRDRFGVKPLVYRFRGGRFVFSSEAAGILAVEEVREANLDKLHSYLAYGYRTNDGETLFAGIHEVPPGHHALLENGRLSIRRYWNLGDIEDLPPPSERAGRLLDLLRDAVRLRFRSDVPVALLQSGGLDSSAICAVVNDEVEAGRLGLGSVTAYTAVHPDHPYDESERVRELMRTCPHVRSIELEPDSSRIGKHLPEFVRKMGEPLASATSYQHWCLMRAIRKEGIKVVINGQGADEALAGYDRYIVGYRLLDLLLSNPGEAWREARAMRTLMGTPWRHLAMQTFKAMLGRSAASNWRAWRSEGGACVLTHDFVEGHRFAETEVAAVASPENLVRHLRSELLHFGFNQILHYEDQSSMSESIEIRSPFVDHRLMRYALSLPIEDRFSRGVTKKVLREAFAHRLPSSITGNHRKIGFATPFAEWARTPALLELVHELVASTEFRSRAVWDAAALGRQLLDPTAAARGFPVWRFLSAELWFRSFGIRNV